MFSLNESLRFSGSSQFPIPKLPTFCAARFDFTIERLDGQQTSSGVHLSGSRSYMNLSRRIEMMSFNSLFKMLEIIILIIVPPSFHYFLYPIHPMGFHSMASVVGWGLALWQIRANITCPKTASGWFCACRDPSHGRGVEN